MDQSLSHTVNLTATVTFSLLRLGHVYPILKLLMEDDNLTFLSKQTIYKISGASSM